MRRGSADRLQCWQFPPGIFHMIRSLLILPALLVSFAAQAFTPDVASLANVPLISVDANLVKAAVAATKSAPLQFAVGADLSADAGSGSWDEPEAGVARWRLRVQSAGASSLSLAFSALQLPKDAQLYLYTDDGADVQGPYTAASNGTFWSPLVRSATAVVEARMPSRERGDFSLTVNRAFHAYRDITSKSLPYNDNGGSPTGNGASGACEVNAVCSAGDSWRDEIRSVVLITIVVGSGEYLCSGSLVNNSAQDDRALILTANHCAITAANVNTTRVYFNVDHGACSSGSYGAIDQNIAGANLIAGTRKNTDTDYTLFELASVPPTSYNAYYAGWDSSGTTPASGVTIHHPAGDDKKISTYTSAASARNDVDFTSFSADVWSVSWAQGTTEEGSSGSALLDQNHRIVGTLSGGGGACQTDSTQNNGKPDFFARLDSAWTAASSTGTTLKAALDPANTGYSYLGGKEASGGDADGGTTAGSTTGGTTTGTATGDSDGGGGSLDGWLAPLLLIGLVRRAARRGRFAA